MNEREWLRARDPELMLHAVQDRLSQRKWVLLNCAVARRMIKGTSFEYYAKFIDEYERDWKTVPRNVLYEDEFDWFGMRTTRSYAPSEWPMSDHPRGFAAAYYTHQSRRFGQRAWDCKEERQTAINEFLSNFPRYTTVDETWNHCRPILSFVFDESAREKIYQKAESQTLKLIRKKARTTETPSIRAEAEANIRLVQKQLVEDMNKAMRNYTKPAKELLRHFLHEQLGNPYQPYSFDPTWRTANVMGLARGIEADRGFDRMNMLADALMEAGCEDEPMLLHLQEEREHQRGCWVLDLILGHDLELFAMEPLVGTTGTEGRHEPYVPFVPLGLAERRNYDV